MSYERIIVPFDGSAISKAGFGEALRLAKAQGSKLAILHVIDESSLLDFPAAHE